jgi:hypothetical protein
MANQGEPVVGAQGDTTDHDEGNGSDFEWPEHFPESCPPSDAESAAGEFYRIVDEDPPDGEDFIGNLRLQQLGLRFKNKKRPWSDDCEAAGLSVLADRDDVMNLREATGPMRLKAIAYGDITGDGVMKHTPSASYKSHHTWWIPMGVEAHEYFRVLE